MTSTRAIVLLVAILALLFSACAPTNNASSPYSSLQDYEQYGENADYYYDPFYACCYPTWYYPFPYYFYPPSQRGRSQHRQQPPPQTASPPVTSGGNAPSGPVAASPAAPSVAIPRTTGGIWSAPSFGRSFAPAGGFGMRSGHRR